MVGPKALITNPPVEVVTLLTVRLSLTLTVPPLESSVKLPVLVSIVLSPTIPIRILSIVAPPFASRRPVNVERPVTF